MCESTAYWKVGVNDELLMENVAAVTPLPGGRFLLKGLLGDSKEVEAELQEINLMAHKILFKKKG
ncbi:MAG: CooT family nickel-binding protein [Myxococcales bacterium]|nr:MAG: CooT family nickel-binding protein [Myxococcales bacterium]